jgi:hypothetical protein
MTDASQQQKCKKKIRPSIARNDHRCLRAKPEIRGEESLFLSSNLMRSLPIAALMSALGIVMTPAAAQSPAEFYKGKTITIMLGHPPAARTIYTHGLPPIT